MEARLLLLSGRSASIGGAGGIGKPLLVRFALDHHQPPAAVSVRHRDTLDSMAAPLDRAPHLQGLPAVPLEVLSRGHGRFERA